MDITTVYVYIGFGLFYRLVIYVHKTQLNNSADLLTKHLFHVPPARVAFMVAASTPFLIND